MSDMIVSTTPVDLAALALEITNLRAMVRLQEQSIAQLEAERDAAAKKARKEALIWCIGRIEKLFYRAPELFAKHPHSVLEEPCEEFRSALEEME